MAQSREQAYQRYLEATIDRMMKQCWHRDEIDDEQYNALSGLVDSEDPDKMQEGFSILQALLGESFIEMCKIRERCYPASFNAQVDAWKRSVIASQGGICPVCKQPYDGSAHLASIDHVTPVAQHWNEIGFQTDKRTRAEFYQDTSNMAVMCTRCNSKKNSKVSGRTVHYEKVPAFGAGFHLD